MFDQGLANNFTTLSGGTFIPYGVLMYTLNSSGILLCKNAPLKSSNGCMIVEGGFDQLKLNNKLWVLNIETDENDNLNGMWKSLETKFQPPSHFASGFEIINNRYIVIFGGRIHPRGKHEELWNGLWILDLGKNIDSIC